MTVAYEAAGSCAKCPWLEASGMPRVRVKRFHTRSCFCRKSRMRRFT